MSAGPAIVAMGGRSLEREVSLRSGHRVERALRSLGYEVQALDVEGDFVERVLAAQPRFVFVAMHGRGGEDGTLQDLLQTLDVPYTGSDPLASALCMDKVLFKRMLRLHGISTPAFHSFNETAFRELGGARTFPKLLQELGLPVVVKPVAQGSAIGIKFVGSRRAAPQRDPGRLRLRRPGPRRGARRGPRAGSHGARQPRSRRGPEGPADR